MRSIAPCRGEHGGHVNPGAISIRSRPIPGFSRVRETATAAVWGQTCLGEWHAPADPTPFHYRGLVLTFDPPLSGAPYAAIVWARDACGVPRREYQHWDNVWAGDAGQMNAAWDRLMADGRRGAPPGHHYWHNGDEMEQVVIAALRNLRGRRTQAALASYFSDSADPRHPKCDARTIRSWIIYFRAAEGKPHLTWDYLVQRADGD
jgi:hypothetical protein